MSAAYVVRSAEGHYLSKQQDWLSGKDKNSLYFTKHKDVALNQLIDITIKNVNVRAKIVPCELDEKSRPLVDIIVQTDLLDDQQEMAISHPETAVA